MTPRLHGLISLACAVLALAGCASARPPQSSPPPSQESTSPAWAHECVWNPLGGEAVLGQLITVSRGPEGPCEGLELGSTQQFELRSIHGDDTAKATAEVAVAQDGSFSFEIRVPPDLRIGQAEVQAVPRDPACDHPDYIDCPPATLYFTVRHAPSALRGVTLVSTGLEAPRLPEEQLGDHSYYFPGPADDQVTLVIIGNGCETLPRSYVTTAPSESLEIVSGVDCDGGHDVATPWTSIIEVPEEYADFESVKVDNVPAELLPNPSVE